MKKSLKKLALNRETLRDLETPRFAKVLGELGNVAAGFGGTFSHTIVKEDCCVSGGLQCTQ